MSAELNETAYVSRSSSLLVLLLGLLFFGTLSIFFGQDINWDLRNYHYYDPYAFLNGRLGFDYAPAGPQTYLNPILDLPFYISVQSLKPVHAGFLLGAFHGLNLWLLYLIGLNLITFGNRLEKTIISFISAAVGTFASGFLSELGTTFNDDLASIFVLWSLLVAIRAFEKDSFRASLSPAFLSALILGIGVGLKLTLMFFAIGAFIAILITSIGLKKVIINSVAWGLGFVVGVISSSGLWMLMLWEKFKSPLFPFYNDVFRSPYFDIRNFADTRFLPKGTIQTLFYPFYFAQMNHLVMELDFRDIRFAVVYVLLVLAAFVMMYRFFKKKEVKQTEGSRKKIFFMAFFIVSYIVWQTKFSIYRYLISLELLSPILIVVLTGYLFKNRYRLYITVALIFMAIVSTVKVPDWGRANWSDSFFELEKPPAQIKENSIILMINYYIPYTYIIPFFPKDARFIRVNFTDPSKNTLYQTEIRELLYRHRDPIYLVVPFAKLEDALSVVGKYNMSARRENCQFFKSKVDRFIICRLGKGLPIFP